MTDKFMLLRLSCLQGIRLLSAFLCLLCMTCCQTEGFDQTPLENKTEMSLTLQIASSREVGTRAPSDDGVSDLTVLLLENVSGTEQVKEKLSTTNFTVGTNKVNVRFPVKAGTYTRIVVVANAQAELAAITQGSSYSSLQAVQALEKYSAGHIPMYGEYAPSGGFQIQAGMFRVDKISLIRMLARVEVVNGSGSGAQLTGRVYYVNPAKNGVVWVNPTGYAGGYTSPTLPGSLQPAVSGSNSNMLTETVPVGGSSVNFYLNEQPKNSSALSTHGIDRPCIVVEMEYNGRNYFYRLDYTWDGVKAGGNKGDYMPVLRNHRYTFTIQKVKGPGFSSVEEALKDPGKYTNNDNIVVSPFVVDEAFTDVVYNEQGFLAVSRTSMDLPDLYDGTNDRSDNLLEVQTNYGSGWKITAYNDDGTPVSGVDPWLSVSQSSGIANNSAQVYVRNDGGVRKGYLEVQAGRLYTKVNVKQRKLPIEYVAEYNLSGGPEYGAHNQVGPLRWAINHSIIESGLYRGYYVIGLTDGDGNPDATNIHNDNFFTKGEGVGYHIPSVYELYGVIPPESQGPGQNVVNEAIEVAGSKEIYSNVYSYTGGTIYGLRHMPATGSPPYVDDPSDFQPVYHSDMQCAYRYTFRGSFSGINDNSLLTIECIHLGSSFTGNITTITNDAWWNANASRVIKRTLSDVSWPFNKYWSSTVNPIGDGTMYVLMIGENWFRYSADLYGVTLGLRPFSDR